MEHFVEKSERKGKKCNKHVFGAMNKKIRKEGFDSLSDKELGLLNKKLKNRNVKYNEYTKSCYNDKNTRDIYYKGMQKHETIFETKESKPFQKYQDEARKISEQNYRDYLKKLSEEREIFYKEFFEWLNKTGFSMSPETYKDYVEMCIYDIMRVYHYGFWDKVERFEEVSNWSVFVKRFNLKNI